MITRLQVYVVCMWKVLKSGMDFITTYNFNYECTPYHEGQITWDYVLDLRNIFSYDNNESTCFLHQLTFWSTTLQIKIYNNVRSTKKKYCCSSKQDIIIFHPSR